MKSIVFSIIIFLSIQLNAQEVSCYCYENPAMKYTEWLYMMDDSVIVVAQMDKACGDLNVDNMLVWARSGDNIWAFDELDKEIQFTKVIVDKKDQRELPIHYNYTCQPIEDGLQVHIEYKPSFQDMMGPPDRFYKKIELKE